MINKTSSDNIQTKDNASDLEKSADYQKHSHAPSPQGKVERNTQNKKGNEVYYKAQKTNAEFYKIEIDIVKVKDREIRNRIKKHLDK